MPASVAEPAERLFSTELQERLTGYPGQWAAVLNDEIVAVAETPKEAYDMGREAVGDAAVVFPDMPRSVCGNGPSFRVPSCAASCTPQKQPAKQPQP